MRIRTYIFTHYLHHSAFAASALPFLVWTLNNIFEYTIHLEYVFWNISLSTLSVKYSLTCGCSICPIYMNKIQIYKCVPLVYSLFFHLFFRIYLLLLLLWWNWIASKTILCPKGGKWWQTPDKNTNPWKELQTPDKNPSTLSDPNKNTTVFEVDWNPN